MERAAAPAPRPQEAGFRDGLGPRRQIVDPTGSETLEVLFLRRELAAVPSFEFALRERVGRLAGLHHENFARVRAVERLNDGDSTLAVVSDCVPGIRLADLLARTEQKGLNFDIHSALWLISQLVPAIVTLHESARDVAHGALGPERLVVTASGQLAIVEHVMGAALEQLRLGPERYWAELRIPLAQTSDVPRFGQRADVLQIGMVALAVILGRLIRDDEYPARIGDLVASTWAVSARGGFEPLPTGLRGWLGRALQLDARNAFASAADAQAELDKVFGDSGHALSPVSLETFLKRHHSALTGGRTPGGAPAAPVAGKPAAAPAPVASKPSAPAPVASKPAAPIAPVAAKPPVAPSRPLAVGPPERAAAPPEAPPSFMEPLVPKSPPAAAASGPRVFSPSDDDLFGERPHQVEPRPHDEGSTEEPAAPGRGFRRLAVAALVAAVLVGGAYVARLLQGAPAEAPVTGTLVLTTNPPGAQAFINGEAKGATPLTLTLPAGDHAVEIRNGNASRTVPVVIGAGVQVAQYIELPDNAPTVGRLQVRTEPSGARVSVDGVPYGVSPLLISDLQPGEHIVTLQSDLGSVKQVVIVESGATAALVVPLAAPEGAPLSGWVSVSAPVDIVLYQGDLLIGSSASDRIMVAAGRQEITLVNAELGYRATRVVDVRAGQVAPILVEMPNGTLALNALPWAEVWLDGERVGETPMGNVPATLGPHSVLFRHPELGEQERRVVVTLEGITRISVDMRTP